MRPLRLCVQEIIRRLFASRKAAKLRKVVEAIIDNLCETLRLCVRRKCGLWRAEIVVRKTKPILVKIVSYLRKNISD